MRANAAHLTTQWEPRAAVVADEPEGYSRVKDRETGRNRGAAKALNKALQAFSRLFKLPTEKKYASHKQNPRKHAEIPLMAGELLRAWSV
jgi:hypothetical protein